jgi:cyclase
MTRIHFLSAGACLFFAAVILSAAIYAKEDPDLTKLAEGVYARIVSPDSNAVSNSGIIVLAHSVLIFDTHFTPEAGQALLDAVRSVTSKPVRYIVNSHSHADHTHGNQVFPYAQVIGSKNARRDVLQNDLPSLNRTIGISQTQLTKLRREADDKETSADNAQQIRKDIKALEDNLKALSLLKIVPPFVTFDDRLTIQDGKQEIHISYLGPGHTDGDIILSLPALKIAFVGDLFFNEAIPNVQDGSLLQWMKTLEGMLKLDIEKFVPGHGKPGSKKDVAAFLAYFEELKSIVKPAVDRGDGAEQASQDIKLPAKYSSYQLQHLFPGNVQKMHAELRELQSAAPPAEKSKAKPEK